MANKFFIQDKKATNKARIATIITALIVLLGLYFITFSKVDKRAIQQQQKDKGLIVNFGTSNEGKGTIQKEQIAKASTKAQQKSNPTPKVEQQQKVTPKPVVKKATPKKKTSKPTPKKTTKSATKKPVVTQKKETKQIPPTPKPEPKKEVSKVKPEPTPTSKETTKPTEEKQTATQPASSASTPTNTANNSTSPVDEGGTSNTPATPTINNRALYPGKKTVNSSGEGNTNNTNGDQGSTTGSANKGSYKGQGSGTGTSGINHSLIGRKLVKEPTISDNSNLEGKITIKIKVDRNGDVIGASLGSPTTISNNTLIQKAIRAAKQTKFNKNVQATEEQFGAMTFIFKVK